MNGAPVDAAIDAAAAAVRGEPPPREVEDAAEIARLAALDPLAYERERKDAAKRLGCRPALLDRLVRAQQPKPEDDKPGQPLTLHEPTPWPEPVDGAGLLDELAAAYLRFIALPDHAAAALALWTVHAHVAHEAAAISPRLAITSPVKRCGKTTLLDVVGALVPRPLPAANVTTAAVYRTVEAARPTLLLDEADTFLAASDELRGVLNAGHRRGGQVVRLVEAANDFEPRSFAVFGPVAIAAIGALPGTLADRSITVELRRRMPSERVEGWRFDRAADLAPLARRCARWGADHAEALRQADPAIPAALHDREADNWRILLAIADLAGGHWPQTARRAAVGLSGVGEDDAEGLGVLLLGDIRDVFEQAGWPDQMSTLGLLGNLLRLSERPWATFSHGKEMTPHTMARLLRPFRIRSTPTRAGCVYRLAMFTEAFKRYLPPLPSPQSFTSSQVIENTGLSDCEKASHAPDAKGGREAFGTPKTTDVSTTCEDVKLSAPQGGGGKGRDVSRPTSAPSPRGVNGETWPPRPGWEMEL